MKNKALKPAVLLIALSVLFAACDILGGGKDRTTKPTSTGVDITETGKTIENTGLSPTETAAQQSDVVEYQRYIGTWYTDNDKLDELIISAADSGTIQFEMSIYRLMSLSATAQLINNKARFGENISPAYSGPAMNGTLTLLEDNITVAIDESEFEYIEAGTVYRFTEKGEN